MSLVANLQRTSNGEKVYPLNSRLLINVERSQDDCFVQPTLPSYARPHHSAFFWRRSCGVYVLWQATMKSSCKKETAQEEVAPNVSIGTACLSGSSSLVAVSDRRTSATTPETMTTPLSALSSTEVRTYGPICIYAYELVQGDRPTSCQPRMNAASTI